MKCAKCGSENPSGNALARRDGEVPRCGNDAVYARRRVPSTRLCNRKESLDKETGEVTDVREGQWLSLLGDHTHDF